MIVAGDKILIVGDSWGCGEWSNDIYPHRVTHLGLEYYLRKYGCKVSNLSEPGAANKRIVEILKEIVKIQKPDYIFWFQSDPIRDLRPYDQVTFPQSISELLHLGERLLNKTYVELNNLGCKIYCIGGVTKLHKSIDHYDNLIPLIDSIIEMFDGIDSGFWISEWIQVKHLTFKDSFLTQLENHMQNTLPKEYFYPDGNHPNRKAHLKIFEYILKQHK